MFIEEKLGRAKGKRLPSREVGQGSAEHKEVGLGLEMTRFKDLRCSSVYEQKFGRNLWRVIALGGMPSMLGVWLFI